MVGGVSLPQSVLELMYSSPSNGLHLTQQQHQQGMPHMTMSPSQAPQGGPAYSMFPGVALTQRPPSAAAVIPMSSLHMAGVHADAIGRLRDMQRYLQQVSFSRRQELFFAVHLSLPFVRHGLMYPCILLCHVSCMRSWAWTYKS